MGIADTGCFMPYPVKVRLGDYDDLKDASIAVLAAGLSRRPGQTRLDMLGEEPGIRPAGRRIWTIRN